MNHAGRGWSLGEVGRKKEGGGWQSEVGQVGIGEGDAEGVQGAFRSIQHYERFNI